jgi:hypothetical protein
MKELRLSNTTDVKSYFCDFYFKTLTEVQPELDFKKLFSPGNCGILVFQFIQPSDIALPPPEPITTAHYYLADSEEFWDDFRQFQRANFRRVQFKLRNMNYGVPVPVIVPESLDILRLKHYLAKVQQIECDELALFSESGRTRIDLAAVRLVRDLRLTPDMSLFVGAGDFWVKVEVASNVFRYVLVEGDLYDRLFEIALGLGFLKENERELIRFVCKRGNVITKIAEFSDKVDQSTESCRIEVIPSDQKQMNREHERLCQVVCVHREGQSYVTDRGPVLVKLVADESAAAFRDRVRESLELSEQGDWAVLTRSNGIALAPALMDDDIPYHMFPEELHVVTLLGRKPS